jgi:hypothetical protein
VASCWRIQANNRRFDALAVVRRMIFKPMSAKAP